VFYISSAIYLAGALLYGFLASGERQPWALDTDPNNINLSDSDNPTQKDDNSAATVATAATAIAVAAAAVGQDNLAVVLDD